MLAAAARANATIYALDPDGLDHPTAFDARGVEQPAGSLDPQQTQRSRDMNLAVHGIIVQRRLMAAAMLRNLATGPAARRASTPPTSTAALDRIADESGHYYMLGYAPTDTKREGRYRKIEVRVKRPGLQVARPPGLRRARRQGRSQGEGQDEGWRRSAARWPS